MSTEIGMGDCLTPKVSIYNAHFGREVGISSGLFWAF